MVTRNFFRKDSPIICLIPSAVVGIVLSKTYWVYRHDIIKNDVIGLMYMKSQ